MRQVGHLPVVISAKFVFKEPLDGHQFVATPEHIHIVYYLRQRLSYANMLKEKVRHK